MATNMKDEQTLEQRIEDLEYKVAFQEHTIEQLNDALTEQQHQMDKMSVQISFLVNKLKAMEPSNMARQSEESPPPHY